MYRLQKSHDATTTFHTADNRSPHDVSPLPTNHKFSRNDVIVLTLQPAGTGDFLSAASLPTNPDAVLCEARVLNVGPSYLDVAISSGQYTRAFGPASNNVGEEGKGDAKLRVRVDRFFSDVPFQRMVAALGMLTSVPENAMKADKRVGGFQMDNLLKELILSTFTSEDERMNTGENESNGVGMGDLPKKLAKPPLPSSVELAKQVMTYIEANPQQLFPKYNEPQLTAIRAALTRRMTMIQGPPGM